MKTKLNFTGLAILSSLIILSGWSHSRIPASDSKNHLGEQATVYGKDYGAKLTRGGTALMDTGGAYSNEQFPVVDLHRDRDSSKLAKL